MTTINTQSPLASYLASAGKATPAASGSSQEKPAESTKDPIAELRSLARQMIARSEGGLLRALNGGGQVSLASQHTAPSEESHSASGKIALPDVSRLDRDEAARLLPQVEKLLDSGLAESTRFSGSNGDKQTDSLAAYRDWLQEKGGISIYV
ncbi:hypothetical protein [Pseudomonas subflava]|uniref:hypothetical protein n=1 Tax=Pseudomonas subflava TaxID=2952933 RepID=UPI00207AB2E8|nr:hypothetical protein [Pseudomonas subflava]